MKTYSSIYSLLLAGLILTLLLNCKPEVIKPEVIKTPPTVTISTVSNITAISAKSGGEVTAEGSAAVVARGVCWSSADSIPTIANSKTSDGIAMGTFTSILTGLTMNTKYFVRAYATNSAGTSYGSTISFTTKGSPVLTTAVLSAFIGTQATSGCVLTSDGGYTVTAKGICWSTNTNPTLSNSYVISNTALSVLINLTPGTIYHVRAYATNSVGTAYGNDLSFNSGQVPGSNYGGGLVVYNNGNGGGLVCANTDQSTGALWGCPGTFITLTKIEVGTGQANTTAIVNNCSTTGTAARICNDLVLNSYSDWFLPSFNEMAQVITLIRSPNVIVYWTSSEANANQANYLVTIGLSDGGDGAGVVNPVGLGGEPVPPPADIKSALHWVRAVRAF